MFILLAVALLDNMYKDMISNQLPLVLSIAFTTDNSSCRE